MKTALSFHHKRPENEISGRLYRGAVEAAQRLECHLRGITSFPELFSSEVTALRMRLKDYCERLMFTDPLEYGKKAEDLLWRKVFYDFFQKCKQNGKKLLESSFHKHELLTQLLAGIGSYHHLLLRLQTEFHLDLNGKVGVPFMWQLKGVKKERWKKYQQSVVVDENIQKWATLASHHILVYLGDLARYIRDLHEPECGHLAERYYYQAFCLNPSNGTPHNQLGSLATSVFDAAYHYMRCLLSPNKFDGAEGNFKRVLDKNTEVLNELGCSSKTPNNRHTAAFFLARFLKIIDMFYFPQEDNSQLLCQETIEDIDCCLLSCHPLVSENGFGSFHQEDTVFKVSLMCLMSIHKLKDKGSSDISTATTFTVALFSLIVHHVNRRLTSSFSDVDENVVNNDVQDNGNKILNSSSPVANSKEHINNMLVENDSNKDFPAKKTFVKKIGSKKAINHLRMLRRRRKTSNTSQDDSELSEGEGMELMESDDEINGILNSDISETGSCSSESLSEHEEDLFIVQKNNLSNTRLDEDKSIDLHDETLDTSYASMDPSPTKHECSNDTVIENNAYQPNSYENNVRIELQDPSLSSEQLCQILKKVSLFPTLKILADWFGSSHDVLVIAVEARFLLFNLVELLNIFLKLEKKLLNSNGPLTKHFSELQRKGENWQQPYPLPEDIQMQGFPMFSKIHQHISFDISNRRYLSPIEEMFLRIQCLLSFGSCLPKLSGTLVTYDESLNKYILHESSKRKESNSVSSSSPDNVDSRYQRQQMMKNMAHLWLAAEVSDLQKKTNSAQELAPYLVVDTNVLVNNLIIIKQLIETKRFIVVVPAVVVANLDRMKKESVGAREATRFLETELKKGSRNIRSQVPTDSISLSPMKYPRKKDKDAWDFFKVLECCNFLCHQQKQQEKPGQSLVTLIIGEMGQLPGNAIALSESIGVSLESVEFFYSKWRNSAKNPG